MKAWHLTAFLKAFATDGIALASVVVGSLCAGIALLHAHGSSEAFAAAATMLCASVATFRTWYRVQRTATELNRKVALTTEALRAGLANELMPFQEALRWLLAEHGCNLDTRKAKPLFESIRQAGSDRQLVFWGRDFELYPTAGHTIRPPHQEIPPAFWLDNEFDAAVYVSGSFIDAAHATTRRGTPSPDCGAPSYPTAYYELLVSRTQLHALSDRLSSSSTVSSLSAIRSFQERDSELLPENRTVT